MSRPTLPSTAVRWTLVVLLSVLAFVVFAPTLKGVFVRLDDGLLVYQNTMIHAINFKTLWQIFTTYDPELYIPLTFFSYQIDYLIGGTSTGIYHFHNLVLHISNALLIMWVSFLLSRRAFVALFCGFLFALHPLHTEAVAWISARKDLQSTFFFLLSLLSYLYYTPEKKKLFYWLTFGFFLCGLLSKVTILGLPFVLLLIDWYEGRSLSQMWKEKLPFFVLSIVFAVIAFFGKQEVISALSLWETLLMALKSTGFYLQKLFVPTSLSLLYPYPYSISFSSPDIWVPALVVIAGLVVTVVSLRWTKLVAFCAGFFALLLVPSLLNFTRGGEVYFASDRYAYLPSFGVLFLVGMGLILLAQKYPLKQRSIQILTAFSVVWVAVFGVLSHAQATVWQRSETLFTHALSLYPEAYVGRVNLGNVQEARGAFGQALQSYKQALVGRANLSHIDPLWNANVQPVVSRQMVPLTDTALAQVLSNMSVAYKEMQNIDLAIAYAEEATKLNSQNPIAYLNLGLAYMANQQFDAAEQALQMSVEIEPSFAAAYVNLGSLYMQRGKTSEAVEALEKSVEIDPAFTEGFFNLGVAYEAQGAKGQAIKAYRTATELNPYFTPARLNLGVLYGERGSIELSREQFEAVLEYDTTNEAAKMAIEQLDAYVEANPEIQ